MTDKESIYVLRFMLLISADEWNVMGDPEPLVKVTDNVGSKSTAWVGYDSIKAAKGANVSK